MLTFIVNLSASESRTLLLPLQLLLSAANHWKQQRLQVHKHIIFHSFLTYLPLLVYVRVS